MNKESLMTYYITNPDRRCDVCDAREVLEVCEKTESVIDTSLIGEDGEWMCRSSKECAMNVDAENTEIYFGVDGKVSEIKKYGQTILKIEK